MTADLPADAPNPRLCHIVQWPDFDGYGFNLHADKSRPGQYIGKIDDGSPAEASGLKEGDRIIEVNGINISNETHKQVVIRIKAVPNETRLLVVDEFGDQWYKERNLVIRGDQDNITYRKSIKEGASKGSTPPSSTTTPQHSPTSSPTHSPVIPHQNGDVKSTHIDDVSDVKISHVDGGGVAVRRSSSSSRGNSEEIRHEGQRATRDIDSSSLHSADSSTHSDNSTQNKIEERVNSPVLSEVDSNENNSESNIKLSQNGGSAETLSSTKSSTNGRLNFNMSAAEMRAHLASKKKFDPRKDNNIDLKKKYQIIQNM